MPFRTVPERGPNGTFCATSCGDRQPVHFESVGRRFEPGGANRCLRRSAAWARRRDLAEPTLSSGFVAHLWHIVTDLRLGSMSSSSIPPEPDGVVVTVTATGGDT